MKFPRVPPVSWKRSPSGRILVPVDPAGPAPERRAHARPGFEFPLRDGRPVFLTPVFPEDRERLEAGFEQLSDRSRFFRFFRSRERLTDDEIRQLTEVDQVNHVAWCALDLPDPPFDGLGSARMIRDRDDPRSAEVAVTVIDAAQRHGLGTILLAVLVLRARMLGIERLKAFVLPENEVVVRWLGALGWSIVRDDGCLEFETPTAPDPDRPGTARRRFERLLEAVHGPLERCLAERGEQPRADASGSAAPPPDPSATPPPAPPADREGPPQPEPSS